MKFKMEIDCDNDAFHNDAHAEVQRIILSVADRLEAGQTSGNLRDINGNTVGSFKLGSSMRRARS